MPFAKTKKKKLPPGEIAFQAVSGLVFVLIALICILPFYYIFIVSISDNNLVRLGRIAFLPHGIHFRNYLNVIRLHGFSDAVLISVSRTVIGTLLTVFTSAFMGYSFSKQEFWGRAFWYKYVVVTMYFGAGMIPVYLNYQMLGLTNTFWIYIIGFVSPYYIILCKTFIESLPASLEESAKLDGAGYLNIFFRIILPLSKPIIATISVFCAVGHWSAYMDTLLYIRDYRLFTLQYVLYNYLNSAQALARAMQGGGMEGVDLTNAISATSVKMTVAMVVTIPVLFVYPFFQRYFVKGIMLGAIKG